MTTVYVGKIPPGVEDDFIRKLLEQCGRVSQWRRVSDPVTGKLKGFGFCDYESALGVLRALKILNSLKIDQNELLLKVDEKTQKYLDDYQKKSEAARVSMGQMDKTDDEEEKRIRIAVSQMFAKRERGEDYRAVDVKNIDPSIHLDSKPFSSPSITNNSISNSNSNSNTNSLNPNPTLPQSSEHESEKTHLVNREIKLFREKEAQREADKKRIDVDSDEERNERDKKNESRKRKRKRT